MRIVDCSCGHQLRTANDEELFMPRGSISSNTTREWNVQTTSCEA